MAHKPTGEPDDGSSEPRHRTKRTKRDHEPEAETFTVVEISDCESGEALHSSKPAEEHEREPHKFSIKPTRRERQDAEIAALREDFRSLKEEVERLKQQVRWLADGHYDSDIDSSRPAADSERKHLGDTESESDLSEPERYWRGSDQERETTRSLRRGWNESMKPILATLPMLETQFEKYLALYREADVYRPLQSFFEEVLETRTIDQCICVALGSFQQTYDTDVQFFDGSLECFERTMTQFVVFWEWVRCIKTKFPDIPVYLQEPRFSSLDETFIMSKGFDIIESPLAKDTMSTSTFLFEPGCDFDALFDLLSGERPLLYIGSDLKCIQARFEEIQADLGRSFTDFSFEPYLEGKIRIMPKISFRRREIKTIWTNWMIGLAPPEGDEEKSEHEGPIDRSSRSERHVTRFGPEMV